MKLPSLSTESLARSCANRPWRTIGAWGGMTLLAVLALSLFLGSALTSQTTFYNNPESRQASQLLEDRLTGKQKANEVVVLQSQTMTVDDSQFRAVVEQLQGQVSALGPDIVESVLTYYMTDIPVMVSPSRDATIISIVMAGSTEDALKHIGKVKSIVSKYNGTQGLQVLVTGDASLADDESKLAQSDLGKSELFGIPTALLILLLVFGAVVTAFVPLVLGAVAIAIALAWVAVIGQAHQLSVFITNMVVAVGFAVGIDYSLFVISRYREERRSGRDKQVAIVTAAGTASRAVSFSGMTVVLALAGMLIVPISIFISLAVGAILVVTVAVAATLTLLPAVLSAMGDRINKLPIPVFGQESTGRSQAKDGGPWARIAKGIMRHPVISIVVAVGVMVAATVPLTGFHLGATGISSLPNSIQSKEAYLILQQDFSYGLVQPARIVIDGDIESDAVQEAIKDLTALIESDSAFYSTPSLQVNDNKDLAELTASPTGDSTNNEAMNAVRRVRNEYIPQAFHDTNAKVLVGGATAANIDYIDLIGNYMPIVFVFVLGLSFLLLLLVFRSIVVPLKAILMNLLSVGATYGLVVLVFLKGHGAGILGFQQIDKFEAWVPIFLFSVLFGLSMDYHVFLLSRIREHFDQTGDNTGSVAYGLSKTGRIITGAALIMVAVFGALATGSLVEFQQMGFGLGVAVFLDATLVRSVLVPSAMALMGTRNWYLPKVLQWLPRIRLREEMHSSP